MSDADTSAEAVQRSIEWHERCADFDDVCRYAAGAQSHRETAAQLRALLAERDAGREWMRRAWQELNAIRARSGAPEGVSHEWWDELVEALGAMLADDCLPWMTNAAKLLLAPMEAERDAARAEAARLRDALVKIEWSTNPRHEVYGYAELLGDIRRTARAALAAKEPGHD